MKKIVILVQIVFFISIPVIYCQSLTALDVVKKFDEQSSFNDETTRMTMTLLNKQQDKRVREIVRYLITDKNNKRSSLIKFLSPADVKGTGFLSVENEGRDDDQWLYLPAFNKSRRISSSSETDYFVGSDFTFEDLNREDFNEFTYSFLAETTVDGHLCYQIKAEPKSEKKIKDSGYSKREMFISKDNYVLVKANFYDKKGTLSKVYNTDNIKQVEGTKKWRPYTFKMTNIKDSHITTITISKLEINKNLSKDLFTLKNLEKQ